MYRNKLPIKRSTSSLVTQAPFESCVMDNELQNKTKSSHKCFCHLHVKSLDSIILCGSVQFSNMRMPSVKHLCLTTFLKMCRSLWNMWEFN